MLTVFGALLAAGWRASSGADEEEVLIGWALVSALAAFFVYALSAPLFFHQFGWIAGVLIIAWWSRAWSAHSPHSATA